MFDIRRATLEDDFAPDGVVVVIDVLRAFTTACFAFEIGATEIILAASVEEAINLRAKYPGTLIAGEIDGFPVAGFDLPNSPSFLIGQPLAGRRLIFRTTAGTQGAVRAAGAAKLLAASLCNLSATVASLQRSQGRSITLLLSGVHPGGWGDEDVACADAIEAKLAGRNIDLARMKSRIRNSRSGRHYSDPEDPIFPLADLECALQLDRYPHALAITQKGANLIMTPEATETAAA